MDKKQVTPGLTGSLRVIRRAWYYVRQSAGGWTWLNMATTLVQGILPLLFIWMMKLLIDRVVEISSLPDPSAHLDGLLLLTILTALVFLFSTLSGILGGMVKEYQSVYLSAYMYGLLHRKSAELELSYFEDSRYHDLFHRASGEAGFRPGHMVNGLFQLLQSSVSLIALCLLLIYLHWSIALALLAAGTPALWFRLRHARAYYEWTKEKTPGERRLQYFHRILTGETFAREIRLFGHDSHIRALFSSLNRELNTAKLGFFRRKAAWDALAQVFATVVIFGVLVWAVMLTVKGSMSTGTIVLFFLAFQRGAGFIRDFTGSISSLYDDRLYMQQLEEFLGIKPLQQDCSMGNEASVPSPGIVFDRVSFTYPGSERQALKDVSFQLPPGRVTALVGSNGAGKSSLVKLVCGLYLPTSGTIYVDGLDTRQWNPAELRNKFSVLFQDFVLYYMTAGENIWFGDVSRPYDKQAMLEAAEKAGAAALLGSFREGLDTQLGKTMGGTEQLSMGEWQKIALSRAFYRDRPYLLLDEPGSALDPASEAFVFDRFHELSAGKTTLVISHRMTAARKADYILVMDKGMMVEEGNHQALLRNKGLYASFHSLSQQ